MAATPLPRTTQAASRASAGRGQLRVRWDRVSVLSALVAVLTMVVAHTVVVAVRDDTRAPPATTAPIQAADHPPTAQHECPTPTAGIIHTAPPVRATAVESALERELSHIIIGSNPPFRQLQPGQTLVEQGDPGDELFLLFDGVLSVEQDGQPVVEVGPGAILGEMALLEGGTRTATLRAVTRCRVAVVPGDRVDREALAEVARRRREDTP